MVKVALPSEVRPWRNRAAYLIGIPIGALAVFLLFVAPRIFSPIPVPMTFTVSGQWVDESTWEHSLWADVRSHCLLIVDRKVSTPNGSLVALTPIDSSTFDTPSRPYLVDTRDAAGVVGAGKLGKRGPIVYSYRMEPGDFVEYITSVRAVDCDDGWSGAN